MNQNYIPKLRLQADISETRLNTFDTPMRMQSIGNSPEIPSFKDTMTSMVKDIDATVKAPDQVMQSAMTGSGADVHDVMIAMSKADIGINLATQMTTKVVQAYEKVSSIQL